MKKAVLLLVLAAMLMGGVPVLADGMFYWTESIPPEIPYQRALLVFDGGYETLIVQSKYRMSSSATDEFGWVVPVPSVPELASIEPDQAEMLFWELAQASQPSVTRISDKLWDLLGIILVFVAPAAGILLLLLCMGSFFTPRLQFVRHRRGLLAVVSNVLFVPVIFCILVWRPLYMRPLSQAGGYAVDVISEEQVGIYNVQVIKAGEAGDLIQWLNENRFQFDEEDTQVFDEYLRRGWCFVVARVDPTRSADDKILAEGLVAPLLLRFETDAPVYPLALTATAGHDTQVLLYVLGKHKWENDGRLDLEYAGKARVGPLEEVCRGALPDMAAACLDDTMLPYLCKFKGTLTPAQMEKDMVLVPAEDHEPYRKHIVMW
jgi:hypothetical protein